LHCLYINIQPANIRSTSQYIWSTSTGQVDCFRCDMTMGQIWRPDPFNCHMFYICELLPGAKYRVHHVTCGSLFWDQTKRICMGMKTGNCVVGDVITRTTTPAAAAAKGESPGMTSPRSDNTVLRVV